MMNRRNFLTLGGALSVTAITGTTPTNNSKPLPEFREGQVLTTEQLNALVKRINHLEKHTTNA